jgi:hypothetical protein
MFDFLFDLRSSALAGFAGIAVGLMACIHGAAPVHAATPAPMVVTSPAPPAIMLVTTGATVSIRIK